MSIMQPMTLPRVTHALQARDPRCHLPVSLRNAPMLLPHNKDSDMVTFGRVPVNGLAIMRNAPKMLYCCLRPDHGAE